MEVTEGSAGPLVGWAGAGPVPIESLIRNRLILGPCPAGAGSGQFPLEFELDIEGFWFPGRPEPDRASYYQNLEFFHPDEAIGSGSPLDS